ncbi:YjjG family noncanonical pyrimidine nucleotidase [Bacillus rubiinfantis]|uniref:YjjG family noncanonical pyrimidine nucleotidase n=1 Tax=Bacillus rubiinfantis TaxID=1499680 RepID=UPI0005A66C54|nr:YjjG family noncanonical pyrimidine nucleotidase [Bacillus rubiinfantis]
MKYETIIFDIDDTLYDFGKSEKMALKRTFAEFGLPTAAEQYRAVYKEISKPLWRELEQGHMTLAELGVERFRRLFEQQQVEIDACRFNEIYLENLGQESHLIPGAVELCRCLRGFQLGVITNGFGSVQKARIAGSPLADCFSAVIVSEEAGCQKPDPGIFDYAFTKLAISNKSKVLMVGDSLTSDIQGGNLAGIDTCWFNPGHKKNTAGITPTYEISKLLDLLKIVGTVTDRISVSV